MDYFVDFHPTAHDNINMNHLNTRRTFLKTLALSTTALIMAPVVRIQSAFSADAPKEAPKLASADDPLVKALGYVEVAKNSKDRKDKKANCANCQFYQGEEKAKQGKCQLIPSGEVLATGWCRSYSVKQKKA